MLDLSKYSAAFLQAKVPEVFDLARKAKSLDALRRSLSQFAHRMQYEAFDDYDAFTEGSVIRVRDCARVLNRILTKRSEDKAQFSVARAIYDLAHGRKRGDLTPAFYAEILHVLLGLLGRGFGTALEDKHLVPSKLKGRKAARERSHQLDVLDAEVRLRLAKSADGLDPAAVARRAKHRKHILARLNGTEKNWKDWRWQVKNIQRDADTIARLATLSDNELESIRQARANHLPFAITPHYLSLLDDDLSSGWDRSIRAQVIPPPSYVHKMTKAGGSGTCDFMLESDTSPINLITRRYPDICIFKPYNTCPQICVYCQRNWEIEDAMEPGAMASEKDMDAALRWIGKHPSIHEVLITGGDPLAMPDHDVERILDGVAAIPSVERIRIGSRVPITMPMRITDRLADLLARYRVPGKRQVAVVTHAQHSYELTPDTVEAVDKLRSRKISVYNQLVFTFFVSRRFEAVRLRRLLNLIGIDPYYTFNTKGKEETVEYRVPIARLLQEQKEEARLLPGLARTDEAVYNVPGLGKNYLRARQHRDLISILPDGARLYEFHPWEKNISKPISTYTSEDVPILDYLERLDAIGEDIADYQTIWYYY